MKILMTTDTIGSVWTYAITLCRALEHFGVEVALATMGRPLSESQRQQIKTLYNAKVFESRFRLCWMPDGRTDVDAAATWLLELERQIQPDLVHVNDLAHGGLPWLTPVLLAVHPCVFSWWRGVRHGTTPEPDWSGYRSLVKASALNADLIVTPSATMLKAFLQHFLPHDENPAHCRVIANGHDWPPLAAQTQIKKCLSTNDTPLPNSKKIVFSAGRGSDTDNNLGILNTIADTLTWPIYVAGESTIANGTHTPTTSLRELGFLDDVEMARWLYRADIFVASVPYEPFSLSILEAARAGCALVLSDIPGLREVWSNCAAYVAVDDAEAMQHCLQSLIDNPDRRIQLATAAWQRAQQFTGYSMAMAYHRAYRDLRGFHSTAPLLVNIPKSAHAPMTGAKA